MYALVLLFIAWVHTLLLLLPCLVFLVATLDESVAVFFSWK